MPMYIEVVFVKTIIHNKDNLKQEDINLKIYRSRAVIINSNNEILLGYLGGTYQFPGGHLEGNETIEECLVREVKEETGIDITGKFSKPFYKIIYYNKDYPKVGVNRYCEFDYFIVKTDDKYDMSKTNFDEYEIKYNYELRYIKIDEFEDVLNKEINENDLNKIIYPEIIDVLNTYLNMNE